MCTEHLFWWAVFMKSITQLGFLNMAYWQEYRSTHYLWARAVSTATFVGGKKMDSFTDQHDQVHRCLKYTTCEHQPVFSVMQCVGMEYWQIFMLQGHIHSRTLQSSFCYLQYSRPVGLWCIVTWAILTCHACICLFIRNRWMIMFNSSIAWKLSCS